MGPIWGRQDPDGLHVGLMNLDMWDVFIQVMDSSLFSLSHWWLIWFVCFHNFVASLQNRKNGNKTCVFNITETANQQMTNFIIINDLSSMSKLIGSVTCHEQASDIKKHNMQIYDCTHSCYLYWSNFSIPFKHLTHWQNIYITLYFIQASMHLPYKVSMESDLYQWLMFTSNMTDDKHCFNEADSLMPWDLYSCINISAKGHEKSITLWIRSMKVKP